VDVCSDEDGRDASLGDIDCDRALPCCSGGGDVWGVIAACDS
jgi:hypothetical protein